MIADNRRRSRTDQILVGHVAAVEGLEESFSLFLGQHYNLGDLELLLGDANIGIVAKEQGTQRNSR